MAATHAHEAVPTSPAEANRLAEAYEDDEQVSSSSPLHHAAAHSDDVVADRDATLLRSNSDAHAHHHDGEYEAVAAYAHAHDVPASKVRQDLMSDHHHNGEYPEDADYYDPESVLGRTADDSWSEKGGPKRHAGHTILSWYKPVYDYKTPNLSDKERRIPRYAGGRFKRWQFILLHLIAATVFFLIIIVPVGYFVVIPKMVQHELNNQKIDQIDLQRMGISGYTATNLGFDIRAGLPAPHWLPITVEIGETNIQLYERGDTDNGLLNLNVPGFTVRLNKGLILDLQGTIGLDHCNPEATQALVQKFSSPAGLNDIELQIRGKFPVRMFGITWYKHLPLYLNLGKITHADSNLKSLLQSLPSYLKNSNLNSKMKQHFKQNDLITLLPGLPDINIQALDITMADSGVTVATTVFLENPTKINIAQINGLGFKLQVENQTMAIVKVRQLALAPDDINKLNLVMDISFDDPSITKEQVSQTISNVLNKLLVTGDYQNLSVAITGPLSLDQCTWVSSITGPFALYLPMGDILQALNFDDIRKMLTLEGVTKLAANTTISATVLSDSIIVPASIVLPRLLALPPQININYNVSAAVYGGDQRTLGVDLWPITILTNDDGMKLSTTILARPENSLPAATALANAINPLLASVPSNSSINLKELSFFAPAPGGTPAPFAWSKSLFDDSTIAVPLPPILCLPCILDLVTKNGTELPFGINSLALEQLATAPGFSAIGSANIDLPTTIPRIEMNLGYASLDLAVERVPAASAILPQGLQFIPNGLPVALNAQAILSRDPALPAKVQNLADSLFKNGSIPSSVGISNLMFGPSANTSFVTFSKLLIELNTAGLKSLVDKVVTTVKGTILKPHLIKPTVAELTVVSATTVNLGFAADFVNPVNISVSLGNLDADVLLNDGQLINLALPPLKLTLGPGGINLNLGMGLATGANGMAESIATLVNEVVSGADITALFSATNVVLSPAGTRGTVNPAIIDQIKTVKVTVPPSFINEINPLTHPDTSPIDLSAMLPGDDLINQLNIDPQAASLETLPGAVLAASAAVGYTNPLALALSLPFAQFTVAIEDVPIVVIQIVDLKLVRGNGVAAPKLVLAFDQTDGSVPDLVAEAVQEVLAGHLSQKFSVLNVIFGASPQDTNDLLGKVNVDLRPITDQIDTRQLINAAMNLLPMKFPMRAGDLLASASSLVEGTIGLNTLPAKTLGVNANVGLKLPFALTLNIGYVGAHVGINDHPLLAFLLQNGIKIIPTGGTSNIALDTQIPFEDDEAAQDSVGRLVANFFEGSSLDTSIGLNGMALGSSAGDTINALSKVTFGVPLDAIIALDGPSDIFSLLGGVRPAIGGATLETRPGNNLGLLVDMGIALPLKINANVGYVAAAVGLNQNPMLQFQLPTGLVINGAGAMTELKLNTQLAFVDTEATQYAVNDLVNNLVGGRHLGAVIGIGGLGIGASATDLITALSKVQLPADLERGMGVLGIQVPFNLGASVSALHPAVHSVKLHTAPGKSFIANAAADFDLPFPVSLRLGYAGLSADMDTYPLADVNVPAGLSIASAGPAARASLTIPQDISLQFTDVQGTRETLRDLVDGMLYTGNVNTKAGVKNIRLGNSNAAGDLLTIVSKIDVALPVGDLAKAAGFSLPISLPSLSGLVSNMGTINVATLPGAVLGVSAAADFNLPLPFPVDIEIGHFAASANLDGQANTAKPVANLNVPARLVFNTIAGQKHILFGALLQFTDTDATDEEVNKLVQQALGTNHLDAIVGANAIQLGDSTADLITAFDLVNIRLSVDKLRQDMGVALPLQLGQVTSNLDLAVNNVALKTADNQELDVSTSVSFNFPLPVSIVFTTGYFYTAVSLEQHIVATLALPTGISLTSLGDKRKTLTIAPKIILSTEAKVPGAAQVVADLVTNALTETRLGMTGGVAGIQFGSDNSVGNVINILSKVNVELGLDSIVGGMVKLPLDLSTLGSAALAGGTIGLHTKPAKTLGIAANVNVKLPFPVTLDIGYFGAGLSVNSDSHSLDTNSLATLNPIPISLKSPGVLSLATDLVFTDTDATQTDIAALVNRALNGPALNGRVGITNILFGASATQTYDLFSKINARLDLDQVAKMAGLSVPISIGNLASTMKVSAQNIGLITQPGGRLDVSAQAGLALPFQVDVSIGHFGTSVGVNSVRLVDVALPITIAPAATSVLAINTTLAFNQNEDIENLKTQVNNVVNHVLNGKADPAIVNIRKVELGASATDLITAFSKIDVPLALDTFLPNMGIKVPLDITGLNLGDMISIGGAVGAKFLPGKNIAVNATANVKLPFTVRAHVGFAGVDAGVNGAPLARVGMPLDIAPLASSPAGSLIQLLVNTIVQIIETDATPAAVAKAVNNYFANVKLDSLASISNLHFGYSATDFIQAFSGIEAGLPLDAVVGMTNRIDIGVMLGQILASGNLGTTKLSKLLLTISPENLINFGLGAVVPDLKPTLAISLDAPYVHAANVAMDKIPLADATLTGVSLANNPFAIGLDSVISIKDSAELSKAIGDYMDNFIRFQTFPGTLQLGGTTIGASQADAITAFSLAVIPVHLNPVVQAVLGGLKNSGAASGSTLSITTTAAGINVALDLPIVGHVSMGLTKADVAFLPHQALTVGAAVNLELAFPLTLNVPYLAVSFGLDTVPAMGLHMSGLQTTAGVGATKAALALNLAIQIADSEALAQKISDLLTAVMKGGNVPGYLVLAGVGFGASPTNYIHVLEQAKIPLPVAYLLGAVGNTVSTIDIDPAKIIAALGLRVSDIVLKTLPGRAVHAEVTAKFASNIPITLSGLNYFAVDLVINTTPVVNTVLGGINLAPGNNSLPIVADLVFPTGAQDTVTALFQAVFTGNGLDKFMIGAKNLVFGYSKDDAIHALHLATLGLPASKIFGAVGGSTSSGGLLKMLGALVGIDTDKLTPAVLMQMISVTRANLDFGQPGKLITGLAAGIAGLPLNVDIDIGFLSADVVLDAVELTTIALPQGIKITTAGGVISFSIDLTLVLNDSDEMATIVAGIVDRIFNPNPAIKDTIGVRKALFGASASDNIDTFYGALITMDISSLIASVQGMIAPILSQLSTLKMPAGWGIDGVSVDVAAKDTLALDLKGHSPNNGMFALNLPYGTASAFLLSNTGVKVDFIVPEIDNLALKDGALGGHIGVRIIKVPVLISALGPFLGDLVFHRPFTYGGVKLTHAGVRGILFGTKEHPFKILSKIDVTINIEPYVDALKTSMDANPLQLDDIHASIAQVGFPAHVKVLAAAPFPIDLKLGMIHAKVTYILNGAQYTVSGVEVPAQSIKFTPTTTEVDLTIIPDMNEATGVIEPLYEALERLLTWTSYSHNARLGFATIEGASGIVFDSFDMLSMPAPDLTFWQPLNIDLPVPISPFQHEGLALLPLGIEAYFPNPYNFALDLGEVVIELQHNNVDLLRVATNGPAFILNKNNGGTVHGTKNLILGALLPISLDSVLHDILHPIETIKAFFAQLATLFVPSSYSVVLGVRDANGQPIQWLADALHILVTKRFLFASLGPIIGAVLTHSILHVLGAVLGPLIPIQKLPFIAPLIAASEKVFAEIPALVHFGGSIGSTIRGSNFAAPAPLDLSLLGLQGITLPPEVIAAFGGANATLPISSSSIMALPTATSAIPQPSTAPVQSNAPAAEVTPPPAPASPAPAPSKAPEAPAPAPASSSAPRLAAATNAPNRRSLKKRGGKRN
ncbi:hypothetical protein HDU88_005987 [Geranomyces variabilis]|nr:hypothetical protein HDU88_005987 [Geranomyces variabilis]